MAQHTRTAFSRVGEVLEHAIDYLSRVGDQLEKIGKGELPERVRMQLDSFALDQRKLHAALEEYADDAPEKVTGTFINYSIELPDELAAPEQPLDTLGLTQWLEDLNQHLIDVFSELAATGATADVREAMGALASRVGAHVRRLSKEYQRFEDL